MDAGFGELKVTSYSMGKRPSKQQPQAQGDQSPQTATSPQNSGSFLSPTGAGSTSLGFGTDGKVRSSGEVLVARSPRSGTNYQKN